MVHRSATKRLGFSFGLACKEFDFTLNATSGNWIRLMMQERGSNASNPAQEICRKQQNTNYSTMIWSSLDG
jgi:hypothetical protein